MSSETWYGFKEDKNGNLFAASPMALVLFQLLAPLRTLRVPTDFVMTDAKVFSRTTLAICGSPITNA
jgi:hypothetical protein